MIWTTQREMKQGWENNFYDWTEIWIWKENSMIPFFRNWSFKSFGWWSLDNLQIDLFDDGRKHRKMFFEPNWLILEKLHVEITLWAKGTFQKSNKSLILIQQVFLAVKPSKTKIFLCCWNKDFGQPKHENSWERNGKKSTRKGHRNINDSSLWFNRGSSGLSKDEQCLKNVKRREGRSRSSTWQISFSILLLSVEPESLLQ